MYKKKEILIIVFILAVTIFLAFLPTILSKTKKQDTVISTTAQRENIIEIQIEGEVTKSDLMISVPYGSTYGYIISKIEIYLNEYSIVSSDLRKRYYASQKIIIESSDTDSLSSENITEDVDGLGKICISTASVDELVKLYGIGQKRAESIIEYRQTHEIDSWESLRSLLGVSDEIIEAIKEKAIL